MQATFKRKAFDLTSNAEHNLIRPIPGILRSVAAVNIPYY